MFQIDLVNVIFTMAKFCADGRPKVGAGSENWFFLQKPNYSDPLTGWSRQFASFFGATVALTGHASRFLQTTSRGSRDVVRVELRRRQDVVAVSVKSGAQGAKGLGPKGTRGVWGHALGSPSKPLFIEIVCVSPKKGYPKMLGLLIGFPLTSQQCPFSEAPTRVSKMILYLRFTQHEAESELGH